MSSEDPGSPRRPEAPPAAEGSRAPRRPTPPPGRAATGPARAGGGSSAGRQGAPSSSRPDPDGPSFMAMIGVVAVVVAAVIVVFFVVGYLLGRLFL